MKSYLVIKGKKTFRSVYFRSTVPKDLRLHFKGRREFCISLKSDSLRSCVGLSNELNDIVQTIYSDIRKGMKSLTDNDVKEILRDKVERTIIHSKHVELETNIFDEEEFKRSIDKIEKEEERLKDRLKSEFREVVDHIDKEIQALLERKNFAVDTNSIQFKLLRRRFIELRLMRQKFKVSLLNETAVEDDFRKEVEQKFKINLYNFDKFVEPKEVTRVSSEENEYQIKQKTNLSGLELKKLSEIIKRFMAEKDNLTIRTKNQFSDHLHLLIEDFGDISMGQITNEMATNFKYNVSKLPPNRSKIPEYKSKSYHELIKLSVKKRVSNTTVNHILTVVSSFMEWSKRHHYINQNYFKGLQYSKNTRDRDQKDRFTDEEIALIFSPENFLKETINKKKYHYYWIPLIGLFTGMRLNEIASLYIDNVVEVQSIISKKMVVFDIREEPERKDKHLKSASSERKIPVHDSLISLDIMGYIKCLKYKERRRERLFEELPYSEGNYGKNVTRFFGQTYLKKLQLKNKKKSFHSFRHTVSDKLKQKGVFPHIINELQGHKTSNIDLDRYGKEYSSDFLYEKAISLLKFNKKNGSPINFMKLKVDWKKEFGM